jgi:hypothetical protein
VPTPDLERRTDRATDLERAALRPLPDGSAVAGWLLMGVLREEAEYVVYAARRGPVGAPAALKLLDLDARHDASYHRHLRRAARRWKRAKSTHLASLVDAGRSPAGPYLATTMHDGPTLSARLARGPLSAADAGFVAVEVAGALDAVLAAGVTPGAVTPRDVVLTASGSVVSDPGIGRGRSGEDLAPGIETAPYLSPEEARGDAPEARSCVYSLACVVYECLTGSSPYPHDLVETVLYAHVADPPPRPSRHDLSLSALDDVFGRAMAPDHRKRHATPGEFARDLVAALGSARAPALPNGAPTTQRTERPARPPQERRQRPARGLAERPAGLRRAAVIVVAAAACAGVGIAVGSTGGSDEAPAPPPAPGPPASAVAAQNAVNELGSRRAGLRRRLTGARRRSGQAEMATLLSRLHGRAARAAGAEAPGVRDALTDAQRAYLRMAKAARARRGTSGAWASGRGAVRRADAALQTELELAARGP